MLGRSETMTQPTMAARQRHRFSAFQLCIGTEKTTLGDYQINLKESVKDGALGCKNSFLSDVAMGSAEQSRTAAKKSLINQTSDR